MSISRSALLLTLLLPFSAAADMIEISTPEAVAAAAARERRVLVIAPDVIRAALETAETHVVGSETYFTLNVHVGAVSGFSVGVPIIEITDHVQLELEGLFGGGATGAGISPVAGGGFRLQINVAQDRIGKNALFISPGIDVYVAWDDTPDSGWFDFGPDSTVLMLASQVDISWVHEFSRHFGLELGLRLGANVGLMGLNSSGDPVLGNVMPEVGLFLGLRF